MLLSSCLGVLVARSLLSGCQGILGGCHYFYECFLKCCLVFARVL